MEQLVYHDIERGAPADIQALKAVKVTSSASEETQSAVAALNVLLRDMQAGNVLIPGMQVQPQPNARTDRFNQAKEQGNTLFRQGRNEEAIKLYTLAAQLAATRPVFEASAYAREELIVALNNRSAAYLQAGDHEKALIDAEASIKLRRNVVKSHFRKGKALIGGGKLHEAREAYLLGLEFDPAAEELLSALAELDSKIKEKGGVLEA